MKHVMTGECDYPGKGIITDEQVWQLVKKHSRLTDRINSRKMVEMTIAAQLILFGIYESEGWYADQNDWMFYGKGSFFQYVGTNDIGWKNNKKEYKRKP